jgi:transposase
VGRQRGYPSNLTDEQWEIIEPMLPLIKEPGRIPTQPFGDIVCTSTGWLFLAAVAGGIPHWQTVYGWFQRWMARGVSAGILGELRE